MCPGGSAMCVNSRDVWPILPGPREANVKHCRGINGHRVKDPVGAILPYAGTMAVVIVHQHANDGSIWGSLLDAACDFRNVLQPAVRIVPQLVGLRIRRR